MPFKDKSTERRHRQLYYLKHRDEIKHRSQVQHARKYGLTLERYKELRASKDNCEICGYEFFDGTKRGTPHIDHDHVTKQIRGVLCTNCNTALGLFGDNIRTMLKAAKYLRKSN